jgi:hypothetical protein
MDLGGRIVAVKGTAAIRMEAGSLAETHFSSGGGGIRTLERPVTSNGFRDRTKNADLQGLFCWCASECASQRICLKSPSRVAARPFKSDSRSGAPH